MNFWLIQMILQNFYNARFTTIMSTIIHTELFSKPEFLVEENIKKQRNRITITIKIHYKG